TGGWSGYKSSGKGLVQQMWYSGIGAGVNTGVNNVLFGENNSVLFNAGVNVAGTHARWQGGRFHWGQSL
ncbi:MAG: hypothetical protein ACK50W_01295, partial [bacterium]